MQKTIEINIGKLKFECRTAGNKEDELVLFLHGFPETSYMWKQLMNDLSGFNFYCVAPNLRGFSQGACPGSKNQYRLEYLADDVVEIAKALGKSKYHLIGHDWGAGIGWKVVHDNRDSIISWTGISVPHLQAFGEAIIEDPEQHKMSSYIRSFQWPYLPELSIRKNDFKLFRKLWKNSAADEIEDYLKVFRNRKQLTATLNYYRSNYKLLKKAIRHKIMGDIHVPTLFIWGNKDPAIGSYAVKHSHQHMKGDYTFIELDSGHWLIQTAYTELKEQIIKHLIKYKKGN